MNDDDLSDEDKYGWDDSPGPCLGCWMIMAIIIGLLLAWRF